MMGIYAVTGGSSGIGAKTVELLKEQGHTVYNIDIRDADIEGNLASEEGRQNAIDQLHQLCPAGMDGLICCAGVSDSCGSLKLILSLNYFGAIRLADGCFDLLQKKKGSCVMVCSNTISQGNARMDIVALLNNKGDEERILSLVEDYDVATMGHPLYVASKYALARWTRRVSSSWAADGVRINAVAPGNVETAMTAKLTPSQRIAVAALPIPTLYGEDKLMDPVEIAETLVFMVSPHSRGINGVILFCDGGTDALLNSEKVY
jgi:NAD(P)-dependent dehydrogenase (short-subunit alcohol dehydrogenase family)